ncbi:hypothetical protein C4A74_00513 [Escherichia coli]|nr:hypothetical protein C4A72_03929 [Escherichia coli]RDO53170.1 hypothetical protein C4A74_00513 [Escherichia coli]
MNILVRFVTIMLIVAITNTTQGGTQTVRASRYDSYGRIRPMLNNWYDITVTSGGSTATYTPSTITQTPDGAGVRTVFMDFNGAGVTQSREPTCVSNRTESYSDSTGVYQLKCRVLVQYRNDSTFQPYDPLKKSTPIIGFAVDTIWTYNGVEINPTTTDVPRYLCDGFNFRLYSNDLLTNNVYNFRGSWDINITALTFNIDDVVYAAGDDVIINYSWKVSPGFPFISAMNAKMYMEQIDSNIAISYVKPDGTGAAVIVPNTNITIEDNSKGLTSNGQIKLKLNSKNEFGTRSSRLRVTVEWQ